MFKSVIRTSLIASIAAVSAFAASPALSDASHIRDHRTKVVVRDHRAKRKNETIVVGQGGKTCESGVAKLYKMGLSWIRPYDCDGAVFHYAAVDGLVLVHAAMSSHSGAMKIKTVGILGN